MDTRNELLIVTMLAGLCVILYGNGMCVAGAESRPVPDNMTKWGPKLTPEEEARVAGLSTPELVEMLKHGPDTMHAFAALKQLKSEAHGGLAKNFDLLLAAAETGGDMIVAGLVMPVEQSSSEEERQRTDKFIDFLSAQLHKEKPSVSRDQAVTSLAQSVYPHPKWYPPMPRKEDLIPQPVSYANDRVVGILTECLDHSDRRAREAAIHWLGAIGANDLAKTGDVEALLKAQVAKEEGFAEKEPPEKREKTVASMQKVIAESIERLAHEREMRSPPKPFHPWRRPTSQSIGSQ